MASHSSILAAGLACLSAAVVVLVPIPWVAFAAAAGESSIGRDGCKTSCGGLDIPFPFGMGPDHCMLTPHFRIRCKDVGNGVRKAPFLPHFTNVSVLNISLEQGKAQVLNHISSYCYRMKGGDEWWMNLSNTPYTFSNTANKFTVVGCRALAYIGNTARRSAMYRYQTGCVSMCFDRKMSLNPCSGMGCCQMAIPKGLQYYQVWFDEGFMSISRSGEDLFGRCSFAVLMDSSNFTLSKSSSNNISSPEELSAFNTSRGGMAPVVLDWSVGEDDDNCNTAPTKPGYACVSSNSFCYNATSGRGYICKCNQGFDGNPYLTEGCQGSHWK